MPPKTVMTVLSSAVVRLALGLALGLFASAAIATPLPSGRADPTPTDVGKHHFQQAIALYNDGNFSAALAEFQAAYEVKPAPGILYNIGLTYKALFLYNDAIRTLEQYLAEEHTIPAERRAEATQLIGEMRALLAEVSLHVSPDGAEVKLDNRLIGVAPVDKYFIAAGRHVLEVTHDGYVSRSKELMVTAGVPLRVAVDLAVVPKTGRVRIRVEPADAMVRFDGRLIKPPLDLELPLGGHTLEASARGYVTHREEVNVAAEQVRELTLSLGKPPLYKRASFWGPLGAGIVVVVGVAVGVGYGVTHRDDRLSGTLGRAGIGQ